MPDCPCLEKLNDQPMYSTCGSARLVELICVTDHFGLGTPESPRRLVFKYFTPDSGELVAVHDSLDSDPEQRLYPESTKVDSQDASAAGVANS